ncbi:uncharacterized protein M6B38_348675 [Iris pallida]|uniref:(S)-ureidoglycine aminohydrolase cupin domain-containing protein n=1 Tax=Iris pallida TaxID=29817 RepID=A0AAX6GT35_IRIPA|nr:uncharacterized protein M6B38_397955 [Iris pallida]KAJ6831497.1 uncharacterized protein M6B38_348675 [Iris pallida]
MSSSIGSLRFSPSFPLGPRITSRPSPKPLRVYARSDRPLEEIYNVRVERGVSRDRLEELGVERWSSWRSGRCRLPWDWHVDQQVYVVSGEVRVVPEGCRTGERFMRFVAGDLVRYPKWFEADLFFDGPYEERYRFRAYGDDDDDSR